MSSLMLKRVAGTKDILAQEAVSWRKLEEASRKVFSIYSFQEIRTPLIEEESLFNRSLGGASEIVQKQMFLIKNKDELYALRPEGTAPIVRSYIENNLDKALGFAKFYYMGPMFRLERPQKGRLRQFHHIGCEAVGSTEPYLDVEIISLADNLLKAFGIEGYQITLNSLGCAKDKLKLSANLTDSLKDKLPHLCPGCNLRFKNNVLRILDCKNKSCREIVGKLALADSCLCPECIGHFTKVKAGLGLLKIKYEIAPHLVRGLDYYTRTVFEITHPQLGSQDALGAGGRYDNLVKELGGPDVGAIGFAFGVERLLLVTKPGSQEATSKSLVYIIGLGEEAKLEGLKLLDNLRKKGFSCDTDYENKSLKGAMRRANDLGSRYVLLIGADELKKKVVTVKDMVSGEQEEIRGEEIHLKLKC